MSHRRRRHHRSGCSGSCFFSLFLIAATAIMMSIGRRGTGCFFVRAWVVPATRHACSFHQRNNNKLLLSTTTKSAAASIKSSFQQQRSSITSSTTTLLMMHHPRSSSTRQPQQGPSQQHLLTFRLAASSSSSSTTSAGGKASTTKNENKDDNENDHGITTEDIASLSDAKIASFGGLKYLSHGPDQFRVVFVLGGPGAGKGTQSALLEDNYPCLHLSAGQLLRDAAEDETSEHADTIQKALVAGSIVPVEISLTLLRQAMADTKGREWIFLIDGFPRNYDNLRGWCEYMPSSSDLCKVLVYTCPLDVLQERIMARSKVESRTDDTLETLQRRFRTFETESMPVVDMLVNDDDDSDDSDDNDNNINMNYVAQINGNDNVDTVWDRTREVVDPIVVDDVLTANTALLESIRQNDVDAYQKLCDPGWFTTTNKAKKKAREVMSKQEGSSSSSSTFDGEGENVGDCVRDAEVEVVTGRQVAVSYTRNFDDEEVREKRIWSHQGDGWRNVHFSRTPVEA